VVRPDGVTGERADQATHERVGGRAILGAVVGIELGDDQAGQALVPGEDGQAGHRLVEGQARVVLRNIRDRRVDEVDHVDVEVEEDPADEHVLFGTPIVGVAEQQQPVVAEQRPSSSSRCATPMESRMPSAHRLARTAGPWAGVQGRRDPRAAT
jgi:hypothetical protein